MKRLSGATGMNTLVREAQAVKIWFDEDNIWLLLADGRQLSVPKVYFPRLQKASAADLEKYEMSGGGIGIHWESLDEDIHVPNLLAGIIDQTVMHTNI
jgi:hypothetical protein